MSISAMKQALEALESVEKVNGWNKDSIVGRHCAQSAHLLRQAIAGAEDKDADQWYENLLWGRQEPVAWAEFTKDYLAICNESFENAIPLYATPPKREWVGLATGEAREFYESDLSREQLIHKIDEFLQEKNT